MFVGKTAKSLKKTTTTKTCVNVSNDQVNMMTEQKYVIFPKI